MKKFWAAFYIFTALQMYGMSADYLEKAGKLGNPAFPDLFIGLFYLLLTFLFIYWGLDEFKKYLRINL